MDILRTMCLALGLVAVTSLATDGAEKLWVSYPGGEGLGKGKHIVLISGDEEYRSEEALPQLGKILSQHHGFRCTVLFAIDPKTGVINPDINNNIPGLEALKDADLMIIATRFRDLPDEQMKHIVDYVDSGRPIIGLRTATHAFNITKSQTFARYSYNSKKWNGGFGRQVLGETWISHHGDHKRQSTRGIAAKGQRDNPLLNGCEDIWGPTDVYGVRLPLPKTCQPLVMGQVLKGMKPTDEPVTTAKNNPLMPVAWTNAYHGAGDKISRVFTTTMGSSTDLQSEGLRRLLVNATLWCLGMEGKIPQRAKVSIVGEFKPSPFSFHKYKRGVRPADHEL